MMYELKRSLSLKDYSSPNKPLRDFKKGNQEIPEGFEQDPNFLKYVEFGLIAEAIPESFKVMSFEERGMRLKEQLVAKKTPGLVKEAKVEESAPAEVTEEKKGSKKKKKE